jgi:hypothetical protein
MPHGDVSLFLRFSEEGAYRQLRFSRMAERARPAPCVDFPPRVSVPMLRDFNFALGIRAILESRSRIVSISWNVDILLVGSLKYPSVLREGLSVQAEEDPRLSRILFISRRRTEHFLTFSSFSDFAEARNRD